MNWETFFQITENKIRIIHYKNNCMTIDDIIVELKKDTEIQEYKVLWHMLPCWLNWFTIKITS